MRTLRKLLRKIFFPLIAGVLLFEEWGWAPLAAAFARLARLPLWAWLERKISQLPPTAAMLVFSVPMLTLLPVKLLALFLFGKGQATLGLVLLVGAKIGGTALMARLFQLTQPALMRLRWFAWWYPRWKAWKDGVLAEVHRSAAWRAGHRLKRRVKVWLRRLWR
jgi:hypothetical protein